MSLIDQVYEDYKNDPKFQQLREFGSQFVPGYGNWIHPKILFCGEAPGVMEDLQGKPFVGRAGVKFAEFLKEINLTREEVWTTNILKYRPPNNRDPLPSELFSSRPYLLQEIEIIQPKVVCPLGRHAMTAMLTGEALGRNHSITKASGKVFNSPLISPPVIPIIHPGRILRPGADSASIIIRASFQKVKELIDGADQEVS